MASRLRVVHRMGNSIDLPASAGENELLYTEDTGRLYKGTGAGKPLISFSDVVTGYATLEDLKISNPAISGKLYLTDDGVLACYNGTAYNPINDLALSNLEKALEEVSLKSHDHSNKEALDKISIDADGSLLFNGKKIEGSASNEVPDVYMDKETYASATNVGNVKRSDLALAIDGFDNAPSLAYYGKDASGAIGFHALPTDFGSSGGEVDLLKEQLIRQQLSIIKMQFKYDIALNFTRNSCGDYLIDTLEDNSGIEELFNCNYVAASQTIK